MPVRDFLGISQIIGAESGTGSVPVTANREVIAGYENKEQAPQASACGEYGSAVDNAQINSPSINALPEPKMPHMPRQTKTLVFTK